MEIFMHFEDQLKLLLSSRHLLIYIVTNEEERLENTINKMAKNKYPSCIYYWDFIDGYYNNPNYCEQSKRNPLRALDIIENLDVSISTIFILKDFHLFINDIGIIRKIKNLFRKLKNSNLHIIIIASEIQIPQLLKEIVTVLEFPLPNVEEITIELNRLFAIMATNSNIQIDNLALAYKGMSMELIRRSVTKLIFAQKPNKQIFEIVSEEKQQLIRQTDVLDFYPVSSTLEDIGGLFNLKQWLKKRSNAFSRQAQSYGLPSPKGILLVGIQGTGKSLSAKAISQEWKIPLLKLDVGKIFGGIVGESESKMRKMIKLSEESAPCVLWIDEIDKAFSRINYNGDSGTANRVLSSFLTWLSEKKEQVFIVATANNIFQLPPEMLRKGRFDEIFFLDLPNTQERFKIFQIHLMKIRPLTWKRYNIQYLSELTESFSGAEIKQSIIEAMHNAFYEKRDFNTDDIIDVINEFIPLAFTDHSTISSLQEWAKLGKVRLASKE
uniref:AAA domain-containing protein Ycf46 n=1 Tax=Anunuuluaehu liula TaxID=3049639 RepID=UPI0030029B8E